MFYLIGLGLGDPSDISIRGQDIIRKCERVFLEAYTSILLHGAKDTLEAFYNCNIMVADREQVEQGAGELLSGASSCDVALLVVGDPLGATTHTDLMLRAREMEIPVTVINNASVLTAVSSTGLDMTRFGEVVSIPFWDDSWKPESFYDKIVTNLRHGLHTLCLLDIKVKEQSIENILKSRKIFDPPRFMRTDQAAQQLLQIISNREEKSSGNEGAPDDGSTCDGDSGILLMPDTMCIACARLGSPEQHNLLVTLKEMSEHHLGSPLHSLVVCSTFTPSEHRNCAALVRHFNGGSSLTSASRAAAGRLYLIGLGMTPLDITIKGLDAIKQCTVTLLDEKTQLILSATEKEDLQTLMKKCFHEEKFNIVTKAFDLKKKGFSPENPEHVMECLRKSENVGIIVWGDPLVYSEYCSLLSKLVDENIDFSVVHNSSLLNTIAYCGLQLYTFGETVQFSTSDSSVESCLSVLSDDNSFFSKIIKNVSSGWHTFCLLHSFEITSDSSWTSSVKLIEPSAAAFMLLQLLSTQCDNDATAASYTLKGSNVVVAVSGLGSPEPQFVTGSLETLSQMKFDSGPVHALIIPGKMHPLEEECLRMISKIYDS